MTPSSAGTSADEKFPLDGSITMGNDSILCINGLDKTEKEYKLQTEKNILVENSQDSSLDITSSKNGLFEQFKMDNCFGMQIQMDLQEVEESQASSTTQNNALSIVLSLSSCTNLSIHIENRSTRLSPLPVVRLNECRNVQVSFGGFSKGVEFQKNDNSQKVSLTWRASMRSGDSANPTENATEEERKTFEVNVPDAFVGYFDPSSKKLSSTRPLVYVTHENLERPIPIKVKEIKKRNMPARLQKLSPVQTPTYYKMSSSDFKTLEERFAMENSYLSDKNGALVGLNQLKTGSHYVLKGDVTPSSAVSTRKGSQNFSSHRVGLIYDECMCHHKNSMADHVEQPKRVTEIYKIISQSGLVDLCTRFQARRATKEEITMVHTKEYYQSLLDSTVEKQIFKAADDVYFNEHTVEGMHYACGSVIEMTERVLSQDVDSGFVVVRPPGHHAGRDRAEGFCFVNNCAVAAEVARRKYNLERILIVDFDVHHGNGIQDIFENDDQILYFSSHRYAGEQFYPGTGNHNEIGKGKGAGYTINVPFTHRYNDADLVNAFYSILMPVMYEFNPQLVICAAGFDAVVDDPLGGCLVSPSTYGTLCTLLQTLAGGKMVMALEGGYNVSQTALCVQECLQVLLGGHAKPPSVQKNQRALNENSIKVFNKVREQLRPYWRCMGKNDSEEVTEKMGKVSVE